MNLFKCCNYKRNITATIIILLSTAVSFAEKPSFVDEAKVTTFVDQYFHAVQERELDKFLSMHTDDFTQWPRIMSKKDLVEKATKEFKTKSGKKLEPKINSIEQVNDHFVVDLHLAKTKNGNVHHDDLFMFLERSGGGLQLGFAAEKKIDFDYNNKVYRNKQAGYSFNIPENWKIANSPLAEMVIDSVVLIYPELTASVTFGLVQLPIKMSAKQVVKTDSESLRFKSKNYKVIGEGDFSHPEMEAYELTSTCDMEHGYVKRRQVYFTNDSVVYFFLFDTDSDQAFEQWNPTFMELLKGFNVENLEKGQTLVEKIGESKAEGNITGNTYMSDKFNCFIAAPEGWSLRPSSNNMHLVEMQRANSRSIARLLAVQNQGLVNQRGRMNDVELVNKAFTNRLNQVKEITQNFKEISRTDRKVHGIPAVESIHTYTLKGIGDLEIKEVTIVRDDKYYLILCQAIGPDQLKDLEAEFDQIISSFGFIQ